MVIHHLCIQTECYEASKGFYCDILGFEVIKETAGFHTRHYNTWLKSGGLMIELQTAKAGEVLKDFHKQTTGMVHFAVCVEDIEREYARIKGLGYDNFASKKGRDIYEVEGGKLMKLIAPEGTIIEFRDQQRIE